MLTEEELRALLPIKSMIKLNILENDPSLEMASLFMVLWDHWPSFIFLENVTCLKTL